MAFLMMVAVGLDVTREDVRRVAAARRLLVAATAGQALLLPLAALVIVTFLVSDSRTAGYVLLLAACPGGGMSNVYVYLARANTALSVTLTALSSLLALVTMPAIIAGYQVAGHSVGFDLPVETLIVQLLIMAVIPVLLGAFVRDRWPAVERTHGGHLRALSAAGLAAIVLIGLAQSAGSLAQVLRAALSASMALLVAGMAAGWIVAQAFRSPPADRFTLMVEFAVRSLAIAMVIEVGLMRNAGFVAFGAVAFSAQALLLMTAARQYRETQNSEPRIQN